MATSAAPGLHGLDRPVKVLVGVVAGGVEPAGLAHQEGALRSGAGVASGADEVDADGPRAVPQELLRGSLGCLDALLPDGQVGRPSFEHGDLPPLAPRRSERGPARLWCSR